MELINIMENRINKVMVFAPHMDDEVIGCGGSILKHIGAGREVLTGGKDIAIIDELTIEKVAIFIL